MKLAGLAKIFLADVNSPMFFYGLPFCPLSMGAMECAEHGWSTPFKMAVGNKDFNPNMRDDFGQNLMECLLLRSFYSLVLDWNMLSLPFDNFEQMKEWNRRVGRSLLDCVIVLYGHRRTDITNTIVTVATPRTNRARVFETVFMDAKIMHYLLGTSQFDIHNLDLTQQLAN